MDILYTKAIDAKIDGSSSKIKTLLAIEISTAAGRQAGENPAKRSWQCAVCASTWLFTTVADAASVYYYNTKKTRAIL